MSVAGIPAFLEERQVFVRERLNGLYGPGAWVLANSICTLPYLFACALLFALISYVILSQPASPTCLLTNFSSDIGLLGYILAESHSSGLSGSCILQSMRRNLRYRGFIFYPHSHDSLNYNFSVYRGCSDSSNLRRCPRRCGVP